MGARKLRWMDVCFLTARAVRLSIDLVGGTVVSDEVKLFEWRVISDNVLLGDTMDGRVEVASTMCLSSVWMDWRRSTTTTATKIASICWKTYSVVES